MNYLEVSLDSPTLNADIVNKLFHLLEPQVPDDVKGHYQLGTRYTDDSAVHTMSVWWS